MQTTDRPPTGPARGASPVRGVVLVAVAVVLGFFILRAIDDTGAGPSIDDVETTGMNATQLTLMRREKLGFIFQAFNLVPALTAREKPITGSSGDPELTSRRSVLIARWNRRRTAWVRCTG